MSDESNKKIEFLAAIFKEAFRGTESNTRKASFLFIVIKHLFDRIEQIIFED